MITTEQFANVTVGEYSGRSHVGALVSGIPRGEAYALHLSSPDMGQAWDLVRWLSHRTVVIGIDWGDSWIEWGEARHDLAWVVEYNESQRKNHYPHAHRQGPAVEGVHVVAVLRPEGVESEREVVTVAGDLLASLAGTTIKVLDGTATLTSAFDYGQVVEEFRRASRGHGFYDWHVTKVLSEDALDDVRGARALYEARAKGGATSNYLAAYATGASDFIAEVHGANAADVRIAITKGI